MDRQARSKSGMGVVLAGGLSSRMGQNKARLRPFGPGSQTLLERAYRLLCSLFANTRVSCAQDSPCAGYPCIADREPRLGPAGGIMAALEQLEPHVFILALACDMPLMQKSVLSRLVAAHRPQNLATMFAWPEGGRPEPLAAIYSVEALPYFRRALARGENSLKRILPVERQGVVAIRPEEEICFFNCNRPGDLQKLAALSNGRI